MSESLSMYQASVPVLQRALRNLREILRKGQTHAQSQGYDPAVLLQSRLYPDMLPLLRQVQIATDTAKFAPARLAGVESMRFDDTETGFDELYARLDRTIEYLGSFSAEQIDGSETREVLLPTRSRGDLRFDGRGYLFGFVLPNLYFHVSTAYAILRSNGVPLGKSDYLGGN
ncbi:DUF1993 domain-containing protein [Pseudoxanthomonas wuyuanensis]|uniref:DUF1993 domain-containing protein n=1 Tax=Pseudoxanthomonas wuyuanensis TaxID=1073196 RepID=A0A286D2Z3_9GAMM|nr:DUF1993 domain-containing protein [Pseudoxanthomonas wuyuanensis]SOD53031.1 hypothetical protein SAMN06296416_102203 [Pseudoxanthomonas wuyuanensis]